MPSAPPPPPPAPPVDPVQACITFVLANPSAVVAIFGIAVTIILFGFSAQRNRTRDINDGPML